VACAVEGAPELPEVDAEPDAGGTATVAVPCPESRRATSFTILVDGEPSASVDLPTTIVPAAAPTVSFTNERSAADQPNCSAPACRFVDVTLRGFPPGDTVVVECHGAVQGPFGATDVLIGPHGTATDVACYFGYPGETFWVEAGGVSSATTTWPDA
jgi:hypothetical protein